MMNEVRCLRPPFVILMIYSIISQLVRALISLSIYMGYKNTNRRARMHTIQPLYTKAPKDNVVVAECFGNHGRICLNPEVRPMSIL